MAGNDSGNQQGPQIPYVPYGVDLSQQQSPDGQTTPGQDFGEQEETEEEQIPEEAPADYNEGPTESPTNRFRRLSQRFKQLGQKFKKAGALLRKGAVLIRNLVAFFSTPAGWVTAAIIAILLIILFIALFVVQQENKKKAEEQQSTTQSDATATTPAAIELTTNPPSADGDDEWFNTPPTVTLQIAGGKKDGYEIYYYFDHTPDPVAYSEPFTVEPGENILYYYLSKDNKIAGEVLNHILNVDSIKPKRVNNFIEDFDKDNSDDDLSCTKKITLKWSKALDEESGIKSNTLEARKDSAGGDELFRVDTVGADTFRIITDDQASKLTDGIMYYFGIQAFDRAGNKNEKSFTDGIKFDTSGPKNPSLSINNGAEFTKDKKVKLKLSVTVEEKFKPIKYKLSETKADLEDESDDTSTWSEFTEEVDYEFKDGNDGERTIYVRYADKCGNKSEIASDSVKIDTKPPQSATILVNNGDERTNKTKVTLTLSANDQWTPMKMMISNNPAFSNVNTTTAWIDFSATYDWTLTAGDGTKTVYARFKDGGENEMTISNAAKDQIIVDTKAPTGIAIEINSGSAKTDNLTVNLRFTAEDDWKPIMFMVSNETNFNGNSGWIALPAPGQAYGWTLEGTHTGHRTVFAKFKDGGENISSIKYDTILYEPPPPPPANP